MKKVLLAGLLAGSVFGCEVFRENGAVDNVRRNMEVNPQYAEQILDEYVSEGAIRDSRADILRLELLDAKKWHKEREEEQKKREGDLAAAEGLEKRLREAVGKHQDKQAQEILVEMGKSDAFDFDDIEEFEDFAHSNSRKGLWAKYKKTKGEKKIEKLKEMAQWYNMGREIERLVVQEFTRFYDSCDSSIPFDVTYQSLRDLNKLLSAFAATPAKLKNVVPIEEVVSHGKKYLDGVRHKNIAKKLKEGMYITVAYVPAKFMNINSEYKFDRDADIPYGTRGTIVAFDEGWVMVEFDRKLKWKNRYARVKRHEEGREDRVASYRPEELRSPFLVNPIEKGMFRRELERLARNFKAYAGEALPAECSEF